MKHIEAAIDSLTRCYAREGITPYLKKMEEDFLISKRPFSVLIMDVDHFKSFNDKYGHLYGDEVLKYFSSSLRLDLEDEENVPFRFGGDEFVAVFPNKNPMEAYRLASRLRKNIRTRSCLIKGRQISVTFSGGIAGYPMDAKSIEDVLDRADKALYYSKNHGRGRITKYSDLGRKEGLQITLLILALLTAGWLLYHFQQPLSEHYNQGMTSIVNKLNFEQTESSSATRNDAPVSEPTAPMSRGVVENNNVPVATLLPEPETSKIYLESGRVIEGIIRNEDDEAIQVEVALKQGKGMLQIKKSQLTRIETRNKPARQF